MMKPYKIDFEFLVFAPDNHQANLRAEGIAKMIHEFLGGYSDVNFASTELEETDIGSSKRPYKKADNDGSAVSGI